MVSMRQQGASTRWEGALERKLTWNDIWKAEPQRIKFMVQAVYDVLPSPANLHVWGKSDLPTCPLCPGRGTLEHIMSSCPAALGGGRYRWRHDQVLKAVAETISSAVTNNKHASSRKSIPFVKAGEKPRSKPTPSASLLSSASDWELRVDLGRQLKFPEYVTSTSLRPDLVLTSASLKQVLVLELTVPWEDRMEEANERKRLKYQELIEECRRRGWKARCEPIEEHSGVKTDVLFGHKQLPVVQPLFLQGADEATLWRRPARMSAPYGCVIFVGDPSQPGRLPLRAGLVLGFLGLHVSADSPPVLGDATVDDKTQTKDGPHSHRTVSLLAVGSHCGPGRHLVAMH
ncbi:hypothetical protein N1851_018141 [Merluccius polli]|uniref:Reverse transcriptase n=1 Tax=Merluccius polli TaxID=89951 RepID=A0AA47MP78_MERPO|nr:hypothetical protein N1851_018141 [Merluccius polli]